MTPAFAAAQYGLTASSRRFAAASTAVVGVSAAAVAAVDAAQTETAQRQQAVPAVVAGQGGGAGAGPGGGGAAGSLLGETEPFPVGPGGGLPLPQGLVPLLQQAGVPQAQGPDGTAPSLEEATVESLLAQRAFEANLKSFQAADEMLGDTLDLLA